MKGIFKAEDLPEKEEIYLKESFDGWRVVYPNKNEDGSINWKNFITGGSWWKTIYVLVIIIMILGILYEYSSNMETYENCFTDEIQLELCKQSFNPGIWKRSIILNNPLGNFTGLR